MTLSKALVPSQSLLTRALMVAGGSAFIALAAPVSVPMLPVPMTLQTLAILLVGFVAMAAIAGYAADRGVKGVVATAAVALFASAFIYLPGVAWAMSLAEVAGIDTAKWGADSFAMVWQYYMSPFLIGDAVKAVLAALIVTGGWAALKSRKA